MAGGMGRAGWGPMTDRVRQGAEAPEPAPSPPVHLKHCWVLDHRGRLPALLLEWRRVGDQYDGRVVRLVHEDGGWVVIEEWLPHQMLEKA